MAKLQKTHWLKVLKHFDNKRYFQNGLTIPFLLGSTTVISPDEKVLTVKEFLFQLFNEELSNTVTLLKCSYLGEYVFGILDRETKEYPSYRPIYREFGNLAIVDNSFEGLDNFNEIVRILETAYQSIIDAREFSKENGKWGDYSDIDKQHLLEVRI